MAEEQPPGAEGSSEDPDGSDGPSPADDLGAATGDAASKRRLCRSSTDKVIAGVAGGIGAYFGIDLVIVRIAFIVLTFLGGAGPFLYLIGWLALPREDGPSVIANALGGDSQRRFRSLAAVVLIGLGLLITANLSGDLFDLFVNIWRIAPYLALILIAAGVALVLWPGSAGQRKPAPAWPPAPPPPAPPPTVHETPASPPPAAGPEWFASAPAGPPPPANPLETASTRPRRRFSSVGALTVAVLFVYAGGAVVLQRLDAVEVDTAAFFAVALAIAGLGLVVSAFTAPARGLIVLGAALLPFPVVFAGADVASWQGIGEVRVAPASTAELQDDYEHGIGRLVFDLGDLQLDGSDREVDVDLGIGEVVVYVPESIRLTADVDLGAGAVTQRQGHSRYEDSDVWYWESRDSTEGGIGIDTQLVSPAVVDPDGELEFDIDVGLGSVRVVTVTAPEP